MLGPVRHRQVGLPQAPGRPAQAERGTSSSMATTSARSPRSELYEVRKLFGVLFQDGALFGSQNLFDNIAFPLREHTRKSEARSRRSSSRRWRLPACPGPRRSFRVRSPAGCASAPAWPAPWCSTREILLFDEPDSGPRPGAHGLPRPADRRPQRPDRRHLPDRHARHQHRAHGAGQHRPALPPPPGDVRPAQEAADQRRAGGPAVPQRPQQGPIGMSEEKDAGRARRRGGGRRATARCRPIAPQLLPTWPLVRPSMASPHGEPRRSCRDPRRRGRRSGSASARTGSSPRTSRRPTP